jgi:hypothetical protein
VFDAERVHALAVAIPAAHWFALCGLPFADEERERVEQLRLASDAQRVERVGSWHSVRVVADDPRALAAYDADAAEAARLKTIAIARSDAPTVLRATSEVVERGLGVLFEAARQAADRSRSDDATTVRVAAGAASEAIYRAALASALGEGNTHRFVLTHALFASGRWPLARIDDTLYVL